MRISEHSVSDGVDDVDALLASGREVAADDAEGFGSGFAAQAARYFLLHFHHTQVSFGLVVVKGGFDFAQEGGHFVFLVSQPHEEAVLGALFGSPLPDAGFLHGGMLSQALADPLVVAGFKFFAASSGHLRFFLRQGFVTGVFHGEQSCRQLFGPLVAVFGTGFEFSQQVGVAAQVLAVLQLVMRLTEVVHEFAAILRQDSGGAEPFQTALAGAGPVAEEVFTHLRAALVGQELPGLQIGHHGLHAGAVLRRCFHPCGELGGENALAVGAAFVRCAVFGDA